jgi:thiamine-monophosphate kinase
MTLDTRLGGGAEFDLIREMAARWGHRARGIGDDAAVLEPTRGESTVVSVDAAIEGRHFTSDWLSPREIGYRAVAAAMSDIAAMAARPTGVLVAIGLPEHWRGRLMEIADGIGDALDLADAQIIGGNLSAANELSITSTILGEAFTPLARSGARAGDGLYVTGRLGGPVLALRALQRGDDPGKHRDRFARPIPRFDEARWLANAGASASIDISDGLAADVGHLAAASGVAIEVCTALIPCADDATVVDALSSGEEYELL